MDLPPPPLNAADLLTAAVGARPGAAGATAVHWVDRDRSLTYAEAADAMARAAAVLSGFGVAAGGRVGLFAHPGLDYVVALLGAWRLGATAVLVDLADKDRFHDHMTAASPDAVVYTNDHFDYVRPTVAALGSAPGRTVFAGMDGPQPGTVGWLDALAEAVPLAEPPASVDADSLALTIPASANPAPANPAPAIPAPADPADSATPKPTQRTHAELIEAASAVAASLDLGPVRLHAVPDAAGPSLPSRGQPPPGPAARRHRRPAQGPGSPTTPGNKWSATAPLCCAAPPDHCADLLSVSAARGRKPFALRAAITVEGRSPAPDPAVEGRSPAPDPAVEGRSPAPDPAVEGRSPAPDPAVEGRSPASDPAVEGRSPASDPAVGELVDRFRTELGIDVAVHRPAS